MTNQITHETTNDVASCGHALQPGEGAAITSDNLRICYACATAREVEALKTADRYTAYLTVEPFKEPTLTTWPGGLLARVTSLRKTRHNIGGYLYRFNAIDVHGQHWYGTSPGPSMYARMHKARARKGAK